MVIIVVYSDKVAFTLSINLRIKPFGKVADRYNWDWICDIYSPVSLSGQNWKFTFGENYFLRTSVKLGTYNDGYWKGANWAEL